MSSAIIPVLVVTVLVVLLLSNNWKKQVQNLYKDNQENE